MSGNRYPALRDGVYLVKGSAGGALYDLRERRVWSAPPFLVKAIEAATRGHTLDSAFAQAFGALPTPAAREMLQRFVLEHPALVLSSAASTRLDPPPLHLSIEPNWLMLEITGTCNLRCCHCYMSAAPAATSHVPSALPTPRWLELIDEARVIGFTALQLTGGEPAVHPDLALLLRAAHERGYDPVALFTNLTILDEQTVSLVSEIRAQIHTSLYSLNAETHDAITGQAGSHDRVVRGIRRMLAAGVTTYVGVPVMQRNAATLRETVDFLTGMGVAPEHIKIECAWPQGRGADLPPLAAPLLWGRKIDQPVVEHDGRLEMSTCWAGRLAIAPNGDVLVCVGEREPLGNVGSSPLRPIAESEAVRSLWRITLDDVPVCNECEFRYACFDCRAVARLLSGDLRGRDPACPYDPRTGAWRCEEIAMEDKPKRKEGLAAEDLDDQLLVADFGSSQFHLLNPTAAAVWEMCDGQHAADAIANDLAGPFGLPVDEVQRDVQRILGEFRAKGLIE